MGLSEFRARTVDSAVLNLDNDGAASSAPSGWREKLANLSHSASELLSRPSSSKPKIDERREQNRKEEERLGVIEGINSCLGQIDKGERGGVARAFWVKVFADLNVLKVDPHREVSIEDAMKHIMADYRNLSVEKAYVSFLAQQAHGYTQDLLAYGMKTHPGFLQAIKERLNELGKAINDKDFGQLKDSAQTAIKLRQGRAQEEAQVATEANNARPELKDSDEGAASERDSRKSPRVERSAERTTKVSDKDLTPRPPSFAPGRIVALASGLEGIQYKVSDDIDYARNQQELTNTVNRFLAVEAGGLPKKFWHGLLRDIPSQDPNRKFTLDDLMNLLAAGQGKAPFTQEQRVAANQHLENWEKEVASSKAGLHKALLLTSADIDGEEKASVIKDELSQLDDVERKISLERARNNPWDYALRAYADPENKLRAGSLEERAAREAAVARLATDAFRYCEQKDPNFLRKANERIVKMVAEHIDYIVGPDEATARIFWGEIFDASVLGQISREAGKGQSISQATAVLAEKALHQYEQMSGIEGDEAVRAFFRYIRAFGEYKVAKLKI